MKSYLSIVRGQKRPVRFIASRALMALGLSERITIPRGEYRLRFYPTPRIAEIWIDADATGQDRTEEAFLRAYLRKGDTIVDIGANVGEVALLTAALVGPAGRVFAVEAHPRIYRYLEGNVALNDAENIRTFNTAVSDSVGAVQFSDDRWDEMNAIVKSGSGLSVPCTTLDALPIDSPRIDLLKIDVEGAEKLVLKGGPATLAKSSCVYFESNEEHFRRNGYSCGELFGMFVSSGFTLYAAGKEKTLTRVPEGHVSRTNENLIAARDARDLSARTGYSGLGERPLKIFD
jgi:FkbM family methyltransferase